VISVCVATICTYLCICKLCFRLEQSVLTIMIEFAFSVFHGRHSSSTFGLPRESYRLEPCFPDGLDQAHDVFCAVLRPTFQARDPLCSLSAQGSLRDIDGIPLAWQTYPPIDGHESPKQIQSNQVLQFVRNGALITSVALCHNPETK
jgi:hypothetical protein